VIGSLVSPLSSQNRKQTSACMNEGTRKNRTQTYVLRLRSPPCPIPRLNPSTKPNRGYETLTHTRTHRRAGGPAGTYTDSDDWTDRQTERARARERERERERNLDKEHTSERERERGRATPEEDFGEESGRIKQMIFALSGRAGHDGGIGGKEGGEGENEKNQLFDCSGE